MRNPNEIVLTNEILLYTNGISIELLIDSLCDREIREQLVEKGIDTCETFISIRSKLNNGIKENNDDNDDDDEHIEESLSDNEEKDGE